MDPRFSFWSVMWSSRKAFGIGAHDCTKEICDCLTSRACKKSGHLATDYPEPHSAEDIECNRCNKLGHFSKNCPVAVYELKLLTHLVGPQRMDDLDAAAHKQYDAVYGGILAMNLSRQLPAITPMTPAGYGSGAAATAFSL